MNRNNSHNEFVGNFNSFFDNESSLTGLLDFGGGASPIGGGINPNPRNLTSVSTAAGPKTELSPAIAFVLENTPKYRCKITPPYYVRDDVNGTILDYTKCPKRVTVGVSTGPQTPPSSGNGTTGSTTSTTATSGDTGSGSGAITSSTTANENKPSSEVKKIEKENCKIDYIKISGFIIIGVILGYFLAKKLKKDPFIFCIIGGIINAIIGYLFYKNKCK